MNIAAWLVSMVGPLTARVLASLGLSLVTMTGLSVAFDVLKEQITTNIAGLPSVTLQLGGLFGIWEGIGIYLGALTFCVTWASTKGLWSLAKA